MRQRIMWWGDLITGAPTAINGSRKDGKLLRTDDSAGKEPGGFPADHGKISEDLLTRNKNGNLPKDAGPVTLGAVCSRRIFPRL